MKGVLKGCWDCGPFSRGWDGKKSNVVTNVGIQILIIWIFSNVDQELVLSVRLFSLERN